jgi:hypothetical protein
MCVMTRAIHATSRRDSTPSVRGLRRLIAAAAAGRRVVILYIRAQTHHEPLVLPAASAEVLDAWSS